LPAQRLPFVRRATDESFTEDDLNKLAYWMVTDSGKTLILHLNYYQFLRYNTEPLVGCSMLCRVRKQQDFLIGTIQPRKRPKKLSFEFYH